jgi:hypothetical protein
VHQVRPGGGGALQADGLEIEAVGSDRGGPEGLGGLRRCLLEQSAECTDRFPVELIQRHGPAGQGTQVDALSEVRQEGQVLRPGPVQVEQDDLAGGVGQDGPVDARAQLRQTLRAGPGQRRQGVVGPQHPHPMIQDDAPLVLDELVVLPCVPVDLQVDTLGNALRVAQHPRRP